MAKIIVSGPRAIFTRPELKVERISYPVITPSAARGIYEAILWKPAIRWRIHRISVLNPIQWTSFRRNELNNRAVAPALATIDGGGLPPTQFVESDRAQRNTVALRDVAYEIEATFELTHRAGEDDTEAKFVDMFRRRLEKGQHFHQPYLGCRECIANIEQSNREQSPIPESRDFGLMLFDIDFSSKHNRPLFFHAVMKHGVIHVPGCDEVKKAAFANGGKNQ